jgi:hypothetical protein
VILRIFKVFSITIVITLLVGYNAVTSDGTTSHVRVCDTDICRQNTRIVPLKEFQREGGKSGDMVFGENNSQSSKKDLFDYISLITTIGLPLVIFTWWLINTQNDKKALEINVKQDHEIDEKIDTVVQQQHILCGEHRHMLSKEFEKMHEKIEALTKLVSTAQIESLRNFYDHSGKISILITEIDRLKILAAKIQEMENYLSVTQQYKIRTHKDNVE